MEEKSEHIIRAEHFKAGWETGIESIVLLLKAELAERSKDENVDEAWLWGFSAAIARIEGETNE